MPGNSQVDAQQNDAELVEAACQGNLASFGELYRRHYRMAVGLACSHLADRHLAEDAAQEAFATACRRKFIFRLSVVSATVAALAIAAWFFGSDKVSYAQAARQIDEAAAITWTATSYSRAYSADGRRSWLLASRVENAWRRPGLYRETHYDDAGNTTLVRVIDSTTGRVLQLDPSRKKAELLTRRYLDPNGPFAQAAEALKSNSLELVGRRKTAGGTVNVLRHRVEKPVNAEDSVDYWIDLRSKQLVGMLAPGSDYFDPATAQDRDNPAEKTFSRAIALGIVFEAIRFDARLDPGQFSLTPPTGFEVVEHRMPETREQDVVEWLEAVARYNDGVFPDSLSPTSGIDPVRMRATQAKPPADRTEAERQLIELRERHARAGVRLPYAIFLAENTTRGSFRYLGKGVKLGSVDRIVCWYRLKSSGKYRAVFGDLDVRDVQPEELPLSVEK
jgi:hypothetical protein